MKRFTAFLTLCCLLLVSTAFAATAGGKIPFSNYSSPNGTAVYSTAYNVTGFRTKTLSVTGIAVAGHTATTLSGTVLVQCAPTANGPWATCTQSQSSGGAAVSTTANGVFTWSDASAYIRASWAKTAGEVSAWLNWIDN